MYVSPAWHDRIQKGVPGEMGTNLRTDQFQRVPPMSTAANPRGCYVEDGIVYPDDDGVEMGDNSAQFAWITLLFANLTSQYAADPNVVVIGNMNWYPVRGKNRIYRAPDVMVVFGRGKDYRGSYIQWRENNIAPQVVFEILSPSNSDQEMEEKFQFYERHRVEEYYLYNPAAETLQVWLREGTHLQEADTATGFVSPRMQIRFEISLEGLKVYRSDGTLFKELSETEQELADSERNREETERKLATEERRRVKLEREREKERLAAEQKLTSARREIEALREQLRRAGIDPES